MTDFPRLIQEAATKWGNECSAFEQLREEGGKMKLRVQAVDIMQQFVGDVQFGRDPRGLLFYNTAGDFGVGRAEFKYYKQGSGRFVTIRTDFHEVGKPNPFARFLARVDTVHYPLPHWASADGVGKWSPFRAATSETEAVRAQGSTRLNLHFAPIRKTVYFEVRGQTAINKSPGVLIFRDINRLKRDGHAGGQPCVADHAPDRIVFHPRGDLSETGIIALFLPALPLDVGTPAVQAPETTWYAHDDLMFAAAAAEEDEDVDAEETSESIQAT